LIYVKAISFTTAHVSATKASLKDRKGKGKKKGRKQWMKALAATAASMATTGRARTNEGLSPQDLGELADLAEKAGSVGRLLEYVEALGRVR
jgi:hypothetical protein